MDEYIYISPNDTYDLNTYINGDKVIKKDSICVYNKINSVCTIIITILILLILFSFIINVIICKLTNILWCPAYNKLVTNMSKNFI